MRAVVVLVVVLVAACCAACSSMHAAPQAAPPGSVGMQIFPAGHRALAPRVGGTTLDGHPLALADEIGHGVVAVNVWASWCGPCRQEMPVLAQASAAGLRVVGIDERDRGAPARTFVKTRGVAYPSLADPEGKLLAKLPMLPQSGVPSTLFVDRDGRVAARVIGPLDSDVLRRIVRLLGGST